MRFPNDFGHFSGVLELWIVFGANLGTVVKNIKQEKVFLTADCF